MPAAARGFSINIERLQYACPNLEELGLNGLGGRLGWEYNPTPQRLPAYRADTAAPEASAVDGDRAPAAAAAAEAAQEALEAEGTEGASTAAATAPLGFPMLRTCEVWLHKKAAGPLLRCVVVVQS